MPTEDLRRSWRFMLEHAGWSEPPGRAACALQLAKDEARARDESVAFVWVDDDNPDISWMDARALKDYQDGRLLMLGCYAVHEALDPYEVALWGISVYSAQDDYCRVVEAELAGEALAIVDAWAAEEAGVHVDA